MREKWERALAVVLLAALLIVPGVIALLGDEDARVNRFTIDGEPTEEVKVLDIELVEPAWDGATDADGDGVPDGADGMKAGSTVAKDPTVRNVANVDAWIAVEVSVPVATVQTKAEAAAGTAATSRELFSYEVNDGWTEDGSGELSDDGAYMVRTYLADAALGAGESTPSLFDEVTLIDFAAGQVSGDVEVKVNAIGVQKEGFATAAAALAAYRGDSTGGSGGSDGSSGAVETSGDAYALILDNSASTASSGARTGYVGAVPMVFMRAEEAPQVGDTYEGLPITAVYADFEATTKVPWESDTSTVTSVTFKDVVKPHSTAIWFRDMESCTSMDLAKLDTSEVVDMNHMFHGCSKLKSLDVSGFDTGKVTDMMSMFGFCDVLTELDLSGFDVSNVQTMYRMMACCSELATIGDVSGWNTEKVTNMGGMFFNCYLNLTELDLSGFDVSNVISFDDMFNNCLMLSTIGDVSGWDTANLYDAHGMFASCESLKSIPGIEGWNVGKLQWVDDMFANCPAPRPSWY